MKAIVTGSRSFGEFKDDGQFLAVADSDKVRMIREISALYDALNKLHADHGIEQLIQGGCPTGADRHARDWAERRQIHVKTYYADWKQHGRSAGPKRNARMIQNARADIVVACPGGKGTADCVRRARTAGIPVLEVVPNT